MQRQVNGAGFATVFWAGIPPEKPDASTQGYLIARKGLTGNWQTVPVPASVTRAAEAR